jgi:DNA-binding transcriptional regulator YdaS (Cro superfamily)
MAKAYKISFRVKSAEKLAERLGVSNARKNRIFRIVEENTPKNRAGRISFATKRKSEARVGKDTHLTLRSTQQSNAQTSR